MIFPVKCARKKYVKVDCKNKYHFVLWIMREGVNVDYLGRMILMRLYNGLYKGGEAPQPALRAADINEKWVGYWFSSIIGFLSKWILEKYFTYLTI